LEKSLKTVGNHNYSQVKFSHPLGLTVARHRASVFENLEEDNINTNTR